MKGDGRELSTPDMEGDGSSELSTSDISDSSSEIDEEDLAEFCARFPDAAGVGNAIRRPTARGRIVDSGWLDAMYPAEAAPCNSDARINSPLVGQPGLTGQSASSAYLRASTRAHHQSMPGSEYPATPRRRRPPPSSIYQQGTIRNYVPGLRAPINQRPPLSETNAGLSTSNPRFHQWLKDNWQHTIEYVLPPDVENTLFQLWREEQRAAEQQQQLERSLPQPRRDAPTFPEDTPEASFSFSEMVRSFGPEIEAIGIREPIQLDFVPPRPRASRDMTPCAPAIATAAPTASAPAAITPAASESTTTAPASAVLTSTAPSATTAITAAGTTEAPTTEPKTNQNVEEKHPSDDECNF